MKFDRYVSFLAIGDYYDQEPPPSAEASTPEEAARLLHESLLPKIVVCAALGTYVEEDGTTQEITIDQETADGLPELPDGHGLFVVETWDGKHRNCKQFFAAVPYGPFATQLAMVDYEGDGLFAHWERRSKKAEYVSGPAPALLSFAHPDFGYDMSLPHGSHVLSNDGHCWVAASVLHLYTAPTKDPVD